MNRLLDKKERALVEEMASSGLTGMALYSEFESNPAYDRFIKNRGKQSLYAALSAMRSGRAPQYASEKPAPAPVTVKNARKKKAHVPAPVAAQNGTHARFRFNNCPNCGCPLHGAQEGLKAEQEIRGGQ